MPFLGSSRLGSQMLDSLSIVQDTSITLYSNYDSNPTLVSQQSHIASFANGNYLLLTRYSGSGSAHNDNITYLLDSDLSTISSSNITTDGDIPDTYLLKVLEYDDTCIQIYNQNGIKARFFDNNGNIIRNIDFTSTNISGFNLEVISLSNGNIAMMWRDVNHSYMAIFDTSGNQIVNDIQLGRYDGFLQPLSGNKFLCIHNSEFNPAPAGPGAEYKMQSTIFNNDGSVHTIATDITQYSTDHPTLRGAVSFDDDSFAVFYTLSSNSDDLLCKIYNNSISLIRDTFKVATIPFLGIRIGNMINDKNDNVIIPYMINDVNYIKMLDENGDLVLDPSIVSGDIENIFVVDNGSGILTTEHEEITELGYTREDVNVFQYTIT